MEERKASKLVYILIFFGSFLFFLYLTFPYSILKEAVVAEVGKNTGLNIRIESFGPDLPLGFEGEKITVTGSGDLKVELKSFEVSVSVFSLLIGRLGVEVELEDPKGGVLVASSSWSLLNMVIDNNMIPQSIDLTSESFEIGQFANFGLKTYAKEANDLIKGTLTKMKIAGKLNGAIEADLDVDDPLQSSGIIDLKLMNASLDLNDPNLDLAKQVFKKAVVKADLKGGKLGIDKDSGFHSQELVVDVNGSAQLKNPIPKSLLNIGMDLKLLGSLKENFDFILGMMGGSDGNAKYKLSGSFGRPNFQSQ
ncbi:MAG: type II secretion system protein GspN [Pseudobacteriovorax sp.]|nr:type II secretion system protein GspN [Pseudobacteriovorax sp.]